MYLTPGFSGAGTTIKIPRKRNCAVGLDLHILLGNPFVHTFSCIIVFKQAEIGARRDTPKVSFSKFNTFSQHGIIKLNHHFTFHLHTTLSILHQILRNEKQTTLRQKMSRGCCRHCTRNAVSQSYSARKVPLRTCCAALPCFSFHRAPLACPLSKLG